MFNRHARTAAASTALLLIAGVAVAQVAGTPVLDRTETEQNPAVVVTVDDSPSADDMTERVDPAKIDDNPAVGDVAGDISGNCDEAEHISDDRCFGVGMSGGDDDSTTSTTIDDNGGESTTSTTIDDHGGDDDSTTSTTIDDNGGESTTSTTIDDHGGDDDSTTSTTIDDNGGDDDDDDSGKGRGGDDDDDDDDDSGRDDN